MRVLLSIILFSVCLPWAGCENQTNKPAGMDEALNPSRDFNLHDQDGNVFHLKDHRGEIILLFFGYTTCPDVWPTTLSKLARVYALLGAGGKKVLTLFVTIDPGRDTPHKLKEYLQYFDISWDGLNRHKTGDQTGRGRCDYKATYEKVVTDFPSALGYMFDHTDYVYLIDTEGSGPGIFFIPKTARHQHGPNNQRIIITVAKIKLDLHEIFNRGASIDAELNRVIQEAVDKGISLVEIIPEERKRTA